MLKAMFNKGIEWGSLRTNPTVEIENMTETGARTRFLDQDEIGRLLDNSSDQFRPILVTALHIGMRRGEILDLGWSDVDLRNRMITVQRSKSGKKRMIPLNDSLGEVLARLSSRFKKGYVFPSPRRPDQPYADLNHTFRRIIDRAGIDNVRFHDLRHTFASHLVMSGVDIRTVQELLGHASVTMTMRYSHLAPVHRTHAVEILDTALRTDTRTDTLRIEQQVGSGKSLK